MIDFIDFICWETKMFFYKIWLIIKHRSFFVCPWCKGTGGESDYFGEWCECSFCYEHFDELEDYGMNWFVGKVPLLRYITIKLQMAWGLPYPIRFRYILKCKLGFHNLDYNEDLYGETGAVCTCCYASFKNGKQVKYDY